MAHWSQRPNTGPAHFNANKNSSTVCLEVKSPSVRSSYYLSDSPGPSRLDRGLNRSLWRCDISKRLRLQSHDVPLSQRGAGGVTDTTVCSVCWEVCHMKTGNSQQKKKTVEFQTSRQEFKWQKEIPLLRFAMIKMYPHVWFLKIKFPVLSHYAALTNRPAV